MVMIHHLISSVDLDSVFLPNQHISDVRFGHIIEQYSSDNQLSAETIAIIGIPQDIGIIRNNGRPGAALAPMCIRQALYKLTIHGLSHAKRTIQIVDIGDIVCTDTSLEEIRNRQFEVVNHVLQSGAKVIVLGGGHDCAFANAKALSNIAHSISVINVDPHLDIREYNDGKGHSGSPFREIAEQLKPHFMHEFGIQEFAVASHHVAYASQQNIGISWYADLRAKNNISKDFSSIVQAAKAASEHVFISFDTDSVSSAYAPGVSAPATIGFTADEFCLMSYEAGKSKAHIIDFVEMNPVYDQDGRTAKLIALSIAMAVKGWLE